MVWPLWKTFWQFLKKLNNYHMAQSSTLRYTTERTENRCSKQNLYTNVPSSIIHDSQKVETTQMPIWIIKMWYNHSMA